MNTKPELHVAFCVTESYMDFCAITLVSLCDNNPESSITAHLLTEDVTSESAALLEARCSRWGVKVCVYNVSQLIAPFAAIYRNDKFHISTNYRLYMADVLPLEIERVLYIDCDMIIRRSLRELYDTPFDGKALLVAPDNFLYQSSALPRKIQHMLREAYFNAGMLVINLTYWRKANISARCLELYAAAPEDYPFPDQDLLNLILRDNVKYVSISYNCQTYLFRPKYYLQPHAPRPDKTLLSNPHIVHFMCRRKAWAPRTLHTYHEDYFKYSQMACGRRVIRMPWWQYWLARASYVVPIYLGLTKSRFMTQREIAQLPD